MRVLPSCTPVHHGCPAHGGPKSASEPLELELQVVANCHEGAGNQTWVPWRISQLFLAAISLSPEMGFLEFPYVA